MSGAEVLQAWEPDFTVTLLLAAMAAIYLRGWIRARAALEYLAAFLAGLATVFIALESPIDVFAERFLWVHMTQHLLLLTAAPLLIMLGRPRGVLLRGLPVKLVKGLGPFFASRALRRIAHPLASPAVCWLVFALSMIVWHLPRLYQLALRSPAWHDAQHACFFWSGIWFWSPLFASRARAPGWFAVPYLLLADILNTAFSAFLIFSGRVLYPAYATLRATGMTPERDQALAGLVMWVPGSVFFLLPAIAIAFRQLSNPTRKRLSVVAPDAPVA